MNRLSFIDERDSEDSKALVSSVGKFAKNQLAGITEYRRADFEAMAKLGLCSIGIREECGGITLDTLTASGVLFEIAKYNLGPTVYLSVHQMVSRIINSFAKNQYHLDCLQQLASGDSLAAFCLTEAQAGSDAASLKLKATSSKSGFILEGEKIYISSAPHADLFLVFARTSSDRHKGISCFLVDAKSEGITIGASEKKMGCEASPIASVSFNNCRIDEKCLLGEIGQGYSIALSGLGKGRISIAAAACGIGAAALEKSIEHLNSRQQFGSKLSEFQGLQFMFADMLTEFRAAVLLTRDAAINFDLNSKDNTPASMAKCYASDMAMKVSTDAVQLLGGAGYLSDYGVEQLMRDAKMLQIVEGTNQIQRLVIARSLRE